MNGETVADIVPGADDATRSKILAVYAKVRETYAVYRTRERVSIQFADSPELGAEQRKAVAKLNPLRGQINGLIDGWRAAEDDDYEAPRRLFFWRAQGGHEIRAKAAMFDRRVADALVMALQGDVDHAEALLAEIKVDLIEERTSAARIDYVAIAALAAALLVIISCIFTRRAYENVYDFSKAGDILWLACGAGALGALFSTAMAMRTRSILTDLQLRENRTDAILRIGIGALAGVLLVAMLMSKIVTFGLGAGDIAVGCELRACDEDRAWVIYAFIAFVAGFSERLVPGLLDRASATAARQTNPLAGSTPPPSGAGGAAGADETNPAGRSAADTKRATAGDGAAEPTDEEDDVDGCVSDIDLADDEATDDSQLPPADGGVEQSRSK